jgi:uncharacterized protein (DUF58 family)
MTRPTTRGLALLALAAATYAAARVLGTWELYFIALAFTGLSAVAWVLVAAGSRRLVAERTVTPEQPVAGDHLRLTFRVRSGRRLPGLAVTLEGAAGDLDGRGQPVPVDGRGPDGEGMASSRPLPARRGVHRLPAFTAVIEDPLGLARARRLVGEPLRLTVVPRLDELASCVPCGSAGLRDGTGRRRLPARDGWEFRGIRPHDPGEPLSRVDWKSTAKTGNLMLRELESAAEVDLTVLLSGAGGGGAAGQLDTAFEEAVRAAGSMASFTLRSGHAVRLLLHEHDWRPFRLTPDATSRRRLLTALAEAKADSPLRLGSSLQTIMGARRNEGSTLLALVVLSLDQDLVSALARLRRQGAAVTVVHVDPSADRGPAARLGAARAATGNGTQDEQAAALAAMGVRYLHLGRGADLRSALAAPPARTRAQVPAPGPAGG